MQLGRWTMLGLASVSLSGCAIFHTSARLIAVEYEQTGSRERKRKLEVDPPSQTEVQLAEAQDAPAGVFSRVEVRPRCKEHHTYTDRFRRENLGNHYLIIGTSLALDITALGLGVLYLENESSRLSWPGLASWIIGLDTALITAFTVTNWRRKKRIDTVVAPCGDWGNAKGITGATGRFAPITGLETAASATLAPLLKSVTLQSRFDPDTHDLVFPAENYGRLLLHPDVTIPDLAFAVRVETADDRPAVLASGDPFKKVFTIKTTWFDRHRLPWSCAGLAAAPDIVAAAHAPTHVRSVIERLEPTCPEATEMTRTAFCTHSKESADASAGAETFVDTRTKKPLVEDEIIKGFAPVCDHQSLWADSFERMVDHVLRRTTVTEGINPRIAGAEMNGLSVKAGKLRQQAAALSLLRDAAWVKARHHQIDAGFTEVALPLLTHLIDSDSTYKACSKVQAAHTKHSLNLTDPARSALVKRLEKAAGKPVKRAWSRRDTSPDDVANEAVNIVNEDEKCEVLMGARWVGQRRRTVSRWMQKRFDSTIAKRNDAALENGRTYIDAIESIDGEESRSYTSRKKRLDALDARLDAEEERRQAQEERREARNPTPARVRYGGYTSPEECVHYACTGCADVSGIRKFGSQRACLNAFRACMRQCECRKKDYMTPGDFCRD